ncbi:hypothetical protein V7S43_007236 [Phytophthora oleae]|uniref:EF-hand domain-containing protein n=1 Tax=Phytophthora oleae TaxID=2107226 RepID=A0ABD3FLA2_9STRA
MAPTSKSASGDKKKTKKSSRSEAKDKDRKSKSKDRKSSSRRSKAPAAPAPTVAAPTPTPTAPALVHDPDAIQLFRRYDRNRPGVLNRLEFLQLLKDYADPASSGWGTSLSRPPLSLTDSSGIPLGYQRADRNSEFEAGQLFERYDKDHTGSLTLDTFHVFFADFKPQLRAFVEESNYRSLTPVVPVPVQKEEPVTPEPVVNVRDVATSEEAGSSLSPEAIRTQYRAALWKLRKICKDELFGQRENIVQQMKAIRDRMGRRQDNRRTDDRWADSTRSKRRPRTSPFPDFEDDDVFGKEGANDEAKWYEAMENDLDQLDELIRYVRRYLNKGHDVTHREMQDFIDQADRIEDEAQCLAMKDYGEIEPSIKEKESSSAPNPTPAPIQPSSLPASQKQKELESLLRVKDQMIYQLLQERTALRKERAAVEASLKKLSDVSTREMKKWARLTDDMQAEIEQLRSQLRSQSQQRNTMA